MQSFLTVIAAINWTQWQANATAAVTAFFAVLTVFAGLFFGFWKLFGPKIVAAFQDLRTVKVQQEANTKNIAAVNEAQPNTIPLVPPAIPVTASTGLGPAVAAQSPKTTP